MTPIDPTRAARVRTRIESFLSEGSGDDFSIAFNADDAAVILSLLDAASRGGGEAAYPTDHDVLHEERTRLRECVFAFASAIKSGENWTPTLEAMKARAVEPWETIRAQLLAAATSSHTGRQP